MVVVVVVIVVVVVVVVVARNTPGPTLPFHHNTDTSKSIFQDQRTEMVTFEGHTRRKT